MPSDPFVLPTNEFPKVRAKKLEKLNALKEKVINMLQEKGIATIEDVFQLTLTVFEKFVWSTQTIESLSRYLMSCPEIYRIVLKVKDDKALALFPGHHKVTSTSFFVLRKEDQTEDLAKADALMEQLTQAATKHKKKKGGSRKAKDAPLEMIDPQEEGKKPIEEKKEAFTAKMDKTIACHATVSRNYGFISQKRIRAQLIHDFIARQFAYHPFTTKDCIDNMPLSLFAEVGGIGTLPKVLQDEPLLFNVIIKCFPQTFLDKLDYSQGIQEITSLMKYLTDGQRFYKIFDIDMDKYQLNRKAIITFPPVLTATFELGKLEDIPLFWQTCMILELLEQVDPNSNALWKKRHLLHYERPTNLFMKPAKYYLKKYFTPSRVAQEFPLCYYQIEDFVKKIGLNLAFLEGHLTQYYNTKKDDIEKQLTPTSGPVALFCKGESADGLQFRLNPESIIDHIDKSSFTWIKDVTAHVALNYFTSLFSVSPKGAIIATPRRWNSILELIKEFGKPTEEELHQLEKTHSAHLFSIAYHRDYRDLYDYNIATASITAHKFPKSSDIVELTTSDYNWRYNIQRLGWKTDSSLGEVIERMRMISLCPRTIFRASVAETLLTTIEASKVEEAIIFLKFSKFLSCPADEGEGSESPYRFSKNSIGELKPKIPLSFFGDIIRDLQTIDTATYTDSSLNGKILNLPGSCSFLSLPSCEAKIELAVDRIIQAEENSTLSKSVLALQDDKSFDIFKIKVEKLNLPKIKSEVINAKDYFSMSNPAKLDYTSYPTMTCNALHRGYMQSYVVFFQVFDEKDLDFLLVVRMIYSFVLFKFTRGCSLDEIIEFFGEENKERTIKAVIFLEEYDFITALSSTTAMPQFVVDECSNPHFVYSEIDEKFSKVKSHYWTDINGNHSPELILNLSLTVFDVVRQNSGIEFLELSEELPSVSLSDLLMIVDTLEADESIYTNYTKNDSGDLFSEGSDVCVPRIPNYQFLYEIGKTLVDSEFVRTKRFIHATCDMIKTEAMILESAYPAKMHHVME